MSNAEIIAMYEQGKSKSYIAEQYSSKMMLSYAESYAVVDFVIERAIKSVKV